MPYIKQDRREKLDECIKDLAGVLFLLGSDKGDLNYTITRLVLQYIASVGLSYGNLSNVTGVLNDVKTEFERRVVSPYEDVKIRENGDAYDVLAPVTKE